MYNKEFLRDTSKRVSKTYGVAMISRLLKNYTSLLHIIVSFTGLFEKRPIILKSVLMIGTSYVEKRPMSALFVNLSFF